MAKNLSTIIIWSENTPGVFFRILWLFRRKMFNIETATVGYTEIPNVTRFTITVSGNGDQVANMCKQVAKLVNVLRVEKVADEKLISRELALAKIQIKGKGEKGEILKIIEHFRAKVLHMTKDTFLVEVTGGEEKIDAFYENMKEYRIIEFVRTGRTALFK
ncbi:acetolactate synthase small subunit [Candidatus Gottesmanbacteria bacterium]|nr:acetolactate synthase small subunit [Candidatus Gottesmanbacteria bacterium]